MCFFKKKKNSEKVKQDRDLISENEKAIDALIALAVNNPDIINEFKDIKEKIKYLIPSERDNVRDYDKKIKNLIADLRIVLVKNDSELTIKANKILTQIKLAIADRNVNI